MIRKSLKGIIPALVTPFDDNEQLDLNSTYNLIDYLLDKGIHGLFVAGTNGEAHLLRDDEIVLLTEMIVKHVNERVPVCSGAGRCSTNETIDLARRLKSVGADYVSVVTPYYLVPSQEDLYYHYEKIAGSVDIPLLLYNIPAQTGIRIEPETAKRLAAIDNICGIKDSGGDLEIQKKYIEIQKQFDFDVFNGSDSLMLDSFKAGAKGSIAATANILPKIEVMLYNYYLDGDIGNAQIERNKIDLLRQNLKKAVAPAVMKKTLNLMGINAGKTRLPIREVSIEISRDIQNMIDEYNKNDCF